MAFEKKSVSTIPLSMRGKNRYIVFHIFVDGLSVIPKEEFSKQLRQHFLVCFGVLGLPMHRLKLIVFDSPSGKGIVRCAHTSKEAVIAALSVWSMYAGKKAVVRALQTSGTLKTLRPGFYQGK